MLNIAHRGYKALYPENTMLAFENALKDGADAIEFDVQMTKDGELVIIHDETLDRTTDGSGLVKNHTLAELKELSASKLYPSLERQEIPTLHQYYEWAKDKDVITNIELKNGVIDYKGIEQKVYDLVKEYGKLDKLMLSSFNHLSMMKIKEIDQSIPCGLPFVAKTYRPWEYIKSIEMDFYHPSNLIIDQETIEKCNENGIGVNIWFRDLDYKIEDYMDLDLAGIISDYPFPDKK